MRFRGGLAGFLDSVTLQVQYHTINLYVVMDNNVLCKIAKIVNLSCVGKTLCDEGGNVGKL